jgi:hypothetical protein
MHINIHINIHIHIHIQATVTASFATASSTRRRLFTFATNAIMDPLRAAASFVEVPALRMHIIVGSARNRKRTATGVLKLSTWDQRKRIYSMSGRNMDSRNGSIYQLEGGGVEGGGWVEVVTMMRYVVSD